MTATNGHGHGHGHRHVHAHAHAHDKATNGHEGKHTCKSTVHEARQRSEKRRNQPQPWIVRKFTVFLTIAIIAYTGYVYIGRLCAPMIKQDASALGSRSMGITFLVVFSVLGIMMVWAYEKVVLTPPGYAKHHVSKSSAPEVRNGVPTWWDTESEADLAAAHFAASQNPSQQQPELDHKRTEHKLNGDAVGPTALTLPRVFVSGHPVDAPRADEENVGVTDTLPPAAATRARASAADGTPARPEQTHTEPLPGTANADKPAMFTRNPSKTPVLLAEYRYCNKDEFLKPYRAHHCRACGSCVLKYDHHCPWVGQCVGARNHKFFLIFVFWASIFCSFTLSTLIGLIARSTVRNWPSFGVDPQKIAIIVISGFFSLFTIAMLNAHIVLITANMTTVEQMGAHRMRNREKRVMTRLHKWWEFRTRRETLAQWDGEWGRIGKEGNMWWLGGARQNWEAVMGDRVWMWFLPVGQSPDDGLSYAVNPRFDEEGRWRPRSEWPKELQ
ncbi:zf-DHHC-domain-containing protein [Ganoderma leucocontextum]|nr:zf-DHHC-domain-containing protein [Ganoderma leucocontextum]